MSEPASNAGLLPNPIPPSILPIEPLAPAIAAASYLDPARLAATMAQPSRYLQEKAQAGGIAMGSGGIPIVESVEGAQVIWQPRSRPQEALLACPVFEVFYGGARGGGKTEASIGDWLEHSNRYGEHAQGIFFRRKLTQLEQVIARTKTLYTKLGAKYNEQKKRWTMPGGGQLKFAYLERDIDAEEYQGHSYTRIYIEEATNFPSPAPINLLRATLRSANNVPCGMRLTGNPGGPGHNWVKKRYIEPNPSGYQVFTEHLDTMINGEMAHISLDRVFIPSKVQDNVALLESDPTYILRLHQSGSKALVKAWLEGDWDIIDGVFFDEFDTSRHVLAMDWLSKIPASATRFRAFDWGSAKPFSVGWYAVSDGKWGLPEGAVVKYREWYGAQGVNVGLKMIATDVAAGILEREKGERISYGAADPSIFIRDGGPSIAESMVIRGCGWKRADNRRKPGWECMRQRLQGVDGIPQFYLLECCEDTIRTIQTLQHDDTDPEDLDTSAEDHAADETRYGLMSRPWISHEPKVQGIRYPKLPNQMTINDLLKSMKRKRDREQDAYL